MFSKLESEDETSFQEMIDKNPELYSDFYGSEICFDVMWQWRHNERIEIEKNPGYIFLRGVDPELPPGEQLYASYLFPYADSKENFLEAAREIVRRDGERSLITCLSERMKSLLAKEFPEAVFDRWTEMDEYLYNSSDLIRFSGKKYHSKRNFVNHFEETYSYEIKSYAEGLRSDVMRLLRIWGEEKGEILAEENVAIRAALDRREKLDIDLLYVDGQIESFIIGEKLRDYAVVMFFKCNSDFKGIYPFMLSKFVERRYSDVPFVSMQEDMGIEGLRKSKESYHPAFMQIKYNMRFEK